MIDESIIDIKVQLKNVINVFMQIYLFGSLSSDLLIYFIEKMLQSFKEDDIDILVFVLHNIGL